MFYNEVEVHQASKNAYLVIGQLIVTLSNPENGKHDFGGAEDEVTNWIADLRDMENLLEYISECTEEE